MQPGRINQPIYIKVLWIGVCVVTAALQLVEIPQSHDTRELMRSSNFVLFVLAACGTLVSNKINFGSYLPGARKNTNPQSR